MHKKRIRQIQTRDYSPHHLLLATAYYANHCGEQKIGGSYYPIIITITFSAMCLESLLNSIGSRIFKDWKSYERDDPKKKLKNVTKKMGISYKSNLEPWKSIYFAIDLRNEVAHGKPELITRETLLSADEQANRGLDIPYSALEKKLTQENSTKVLKSISLIISILIKSLTPEQLIGISTDGWLTRTEIHKG